MIRLLPTTLQLAKKKYIFLEASGYSTWNIAGWLSAWLVSPLTF